MQRIAAANSEDRDLLNILKKVLQRELGHDRFMELITMANQAHADLKAQKDKPH